MIKELDYLGHKAFVEVRDPNEHIQKHWMLGQFYETQRNGLLNYIYLNEPKGGKYIDIGASIGNHSVFFLAVMKAEELHAFEPNPDSYNQLCDNCIPLSTRHPNYYYLTAIGEKKGVCSMISKSQINLGMMEVSENTGLIPINPLDSYIEELQGYDVIKIDVEHYNRQVIMGALETFKRGTGSIYIEAESEAERDETDALMLLCDYKRVPNLKFNHTPTYLYKKI